MNEEYLKSVFEATGGNELGYSYDDFVYAMSNDSDYNKQVFDVFGGKEAGYSYDDFSFATGLTSKKKKKIKSQ